jgi:CheY-like chemotaxis protein
LLLKKLGHQVEAAEDGVEGIEKGLANRPDVALIDIGLPRLDGFEVGRRLREALGREVVIVAQTGYDGVQDRARAREAGFDGYLVKPLSFEDLRSWLAWARLRG